MGCVSSYVLHPVLPPFYRCRPSVSYDVDDLSVASSNCMSSFRFEVHNAFNWTMRTRASISCARTTIRCRCVYSWKFLFPRSGLNKIKKGLNAGAGLDSRRSMEYKNHYDGQRNERPLFWIPNLRRLIEGQMPMSNSDAVLMFQLSMLGAYRRVGACVRLCMLDTCLEFQNSRSTSIIRSLRRRSLSAF